MLAVALLVSWFRRWFANYELLPSSACALMHFSRLWAGRRLPAEEYIAAYRVQLMRVLSAAARQCLKTTNATAGSDRYGQEQRAHPADKAAIFLVRVLEGTIIDITTWGT